MKLSLSSFSDRTCDSTDTNGEDTSSSSEEEKEREGMGQTNGSAEDHMTLDTHSSRVNGVTHTHHEEEEEEEEEEEDPNALPTIYFSHTVELKKVRRF